MLLIKHPIHNPFRLYK
uniref:Uncharacterized protein n=1 Tax=Arundo donax TaxID=35708 RepID=A0A0A8ZAG0_ARUDO